MAKKQATKTVTVADILKDNEAASSLVDIPDIEKLPSGIVSLDAMLDGGFPRGKMAELFGPEGGGKSGIALSTAAQAQNLGTVVWIDLEDAFNPEIAERSGVNLETLAYVGPMYAEKAMQTIEDLLETEDIALIVVDSVAGMTTRAEAEGAYGDAHVGGVARLMSQAMRKLSQKLSKTNATLIWVNQIRDLIGVIGYGPKSTTTGGRGLKFWCSTRIQVAQIGKVKKGESDIVGQKVKVYTQKARFSKQFQTATFDILYDTGISNGSGLVEIALNAGVIAKKGSWLVDVETGETLAQGALNYAVALDEDAEAFAALLEKVTY